MQEHIRRAHPEHYIPKLPATEESFLLMIHTPPSERKLESSPAANSKSQNYRPITLNGNGFFQSCIANPSTDFHDRLSYHPDERSTPGTPRGDHIGLGAAGAAAALAELGGVKSERGSVEAVRPFPIPIEA